MVPLDKNRFFQGFSPEGVERLLKDAKPMDVAADTLLFKEGDFPDYLYLISEGQVSFFKGGEGDKRVVIANVGEGEFFGELGILDDAGRTTGAITQTPIRIAAVDRESVREVLHTESAQVTMNLFKRVIGYVRSTNEKFTQEVLNKEKMEFIGEMASAMIHDFRSPMTGIQLAAQFLGLQHKDADSQKWCHLIRDQIDRMTSMAQELLDYSRGKPSLNVAPVCIAALLEKFRALNQDYVDKAKVVLTIHARDLTVPLDANRLLRVLQNLVSNAVDALAAHPDGKIDITANDKDQWLHLTIADNGPGIPEVIRERLFEPFVTHGKSHGTGLGMAIARSFIQAHGGTITFETETGKGTTFLIRLPL